LYGCDVKTKAVDPSKFKEANDCNDHHEDNEYCKELDKQWQSQKALPIILRPIFTAKIDPYLGNAHRPPPKSQGTKSSEMTKRHFSHDSFLVSQARCPKLGVSLQNKESDRLFQVNVF
jgi:hypothetical protein